MTEEIIATAEKVIAGTYQRFPVVFEKGSGATLWDTEGRVYTDFIAGIAVCSLGHAHPAVAEALCRQAQRLLHVSNLYYTVSPGRAGRVADGKQLCRPCVLRQQRGRGQRGGPQADP